MRLEGEVGKSSPLAGVRVGQRSSPIGPARHFRDPNRTSRILAENQVVWHRFVQPRTPSTGAFSVLTSYLLPPNNFLKDVQNL